MAIFIGIDSGTQGVKGVALDLDSGRVVAEARAPHSMIPGLPPGHCEQDPGQWVSALDSVLGEIAVAIDRSSVRGIGVSGQQHGFVPLDQHGKVIRPAKLWCDTSTAEECRLLTRRLGGLKGVLGKTGLPFLPGYTAPKILWMKRHEPAGFRRLRHVLLPHDFLNFHLTGNFRMEYGDASGTGLMDVRKRVWSAAAIAAVDRRLAGCLPPLSGPFEPAGILRSDLAARFGLPEGIVVSAGGGDNMMAAIGTGAVRPGVVTASLGTSGTIYAFSKRPVIDPRGEIGAFCSSTGGWLPLLCTMNVTTVTERVRELVELDHAGLDAAAAAAPPGAGGLILLPYLAGERTPDVPDGSGVLFGLNADNFASGQLARAAMEGVALGLNFGLRRLIGLGVKPTEIRLTGGGSRSPVWRQILADIFGIPVVGMNVPEAGAMGAAIQAAATAGTGTGLSALCDRLVALDESTRCRPNRALRPLYRGLQGLHDSLSAMARPLFNKQRDLALALRHAP